MRKFSTLAACLLGAGSLTQPTSAQSVHTTTVTIEDLKLDSTAGQKQLDRRLSSAVRKVCGRYNMRALEERERYLECAKLTRAASEAAKRAAIEAFQRAAPANSTEYASARS